MGRSRKVAVAALIGAGVVGLAMASAFASAGWFGAMTGSAQSRAYGMMGQGYPDMMRPGYPGTMGQGYPGVMGSGYASIGHGFVGQSAVTVPVTSVGELGNAVPRGGSVDSNHNRITFTGADVTLNVIGSPPGQKDATFRVAGLVNPTLIVPRGSTIRIRFLNADTQMSHNLVVTAGAPPFGYASPVAFPGAAAPVLSPPTGGTAHGADMVFAAVQSGTYTYLCTVPGHAQEGMYGHFIVQG